MIDALYDISLCCAIINNECIAWYKFIWCDNKRWIVISLSDDDDIWLMIVML